MPSADRWQWRAAEADAAERLAAAQNATGMVPNIYTMLVNSPGLFSTCLDGYQRFRTGSGLLDTHGRRSATDVAAFRQAGFTDEQVLELLPAIAVKTISNWANHLFQTPVDDIVAGRTWSARQPA